MTYSTREPTQTQTVHTARNTQDHKKYTVLYEKGHSAQLGMFWMTHHTKPDPKIDAGDASLLMGSINSTKLD
jgi:hypothetical protein